MSWFTIAYLCFLVAALVYIVWLWIEIDRSSKAKQEAISDFAEALFLSAAKTEKLLKDIENEEIRNQSSTRKR